MTSQTRVDLEGLLPDAVRIERLPNGNISIDTPPKPWTVTFDVYGVPAPQGSKSAFRAKNGKTFVKESNPLGHARWRNAVADKAREQNTQFTKAIDVSIIFDFPMPKSRTKAQHAAGTIPKITAPDIDKLLRCVFDGLMAGGLITDDALICGVTSIKRETTGSTGAHITITTRSTT